MSYIQQIHNEVTKAISGMPHELMKNERFGAWAVTAVANVFCRILKLMNFNKEKAYQLIEDIWDNQETTYKILN